LSPSVDGAIPRSTTSAVAAVRSGSGGDRECDCAGRVGRPLDEFDARGRPELAGDGRGLGADREQDDDAPDEKRARHADNQHREAVAPGPAGRERAPVAHGRGLRIALPSARGGVNCWWIPAGASLG